MKKICSKCGIEKDFSEYHKEKTGKYGVRAECKECNKKRAREYHHKNREAQIKRMKKRRESNEWKEWNEKYYAKNRDHIIKTTTAYKKANKEKVRKTRNKYVKERWANDSLFKLSKTISNFCWRVTDAVKQDKELRSLEYLGCSLEEFKSHIESLWLDGMSWDNHGDWHIDHKVPLAWYVKNSDDPWEANHYSNLQPLWATDNFSKGSSI